MAKAHRADSEADRLSCRKAAGRRDGIGKQMTEQARFVVVVGGGVVCRFLNVCIIDIRLTD